MTQKHSGGGHRRRRPTVGGPRGPRRDNVSELHPVEDPPDIANFEEWSLGPDILRAIAAMDIVKPTPIQALTIGPVLEGRDVIAKAQTGTGKTLAFGAPMMAKIDPGRSTVLGLVMCPTRELAQQVHSVLATLGLPRGVRVAMCVGGDPLQPQVAQLQAGAQVVVGTPGRILDLYQQRFLSFPWTEYVVLDEADKMFEIGFIDDIKKILSFTPEERNTLLFSATFPTEVLKLARESTRNPLEVATAVGTVTVDTVDQSFIELSDDERPMALTRLIEQSGPKDVFLVFCGRRTEVDKLFRSLGRARIELKALHGGYDQAARFRVISAFRTGEVKALIATDVASRGLDVQHVTHVINYDVPRDAEDYTHRIGRTGRAGRSGIAITFVTPRDGRSWREILSRTGATVKEMEAPQRSGYRGARPQQETREERAPSRRPRRGDEAPARSSERERPTRERSDSARPERDRPARGRSERERPERERPERERPERERPVGERPRVERAERSEPGTGTGRSERGEGSRGGRGRSRSSSEASETERPRNEADGERGRRRRAQGSGSSSTGERRPEGQSSERARGASTDRPARGRGRGGNGGERSGSKTTSEGERGRAKAPPIQDRSPEPGPRSSRRRRPGSTRPAVDHHDPDGLGRWGNRAEDFD